MINQQYADDTSWITSSKETKENIKKEVPKILKLKNLQVNEGKTEEHTVKRGGDESWKTCKYLGSFLDTESDIKRRKVLAMNAYNELKYIFENKKVSLTVKLRIFKWHIESIFMYNSELWTVTKKLESTIDVFQRNILRKILNIRWPDKISNDKLYEKTKESPWSKTVKKRRLKWYGHLIRLPEETPAKQALREAQKASRKPRGGQKLTWLKLVKKDLENVKVKVVVKGGGLKTVEHEEVAKNRQNWQCVINSAMSHS